MATTPFILTTDVTMGDFTGIDGAEVSGLDDGGERGAGRGDDDGDGTFRAPEVLIAADDANSRAQRAQLQAGAQAVQGAGHGAGGEVGAIGVEVAGAELSDDSGSAGAPRVRAVKGGAAVQGKVKAGKAGKQQACTSSEVAGGGVGARLIRAGLSRAGTAATPVATQAERTDWLRGFDLEAVGFDFMVPRAGDKGGALGDCAGDGAAVVGKGKGPGRVDQHGEEGGEGRNGGVNSGGAGFPRRTIPT